MAVNARYSVVARSYQNGEPGELLAFAVTEPEDIPRVIGEFRTRFSDRDDVLVDLDATPAA
ncbi:hypothetical protein [Streptomyces sp. AMCC400023]|uniref:hypothetical protein n=1 Tax=Streptomyces sp. AMCC400023 TaxID=2056258 RepID=UPI001F302168|nr:hypothetical protein [Streptomyces sp. AMCC400023]UJV42958.1 hypothetical protein CVT30_26725 [Streptomyces sp. AMCC400023]